MDQDFQQLERSPEIEPGAVYFDMPAAGWQVFLDHAYVYAHTNVLYIGQERGTFCKSDLTWM